MHQQRGTAVTYGTSKDRQTPNTIVAANLIYLKMVGVGSHSLGIICSDDLHGHILAKTI